MNSQSNYKWYILSLVMLTNVLVVAMPAMGMSVMAKEIAQDLGLNLVQVGVVWGIGSLLAIPANLLSGAIGDKIGAKRVLTICSLLAGLLGAARGLASDYVSLVIVVVFLGAIIPFIITNGIKTAGQWFPAHQLGLANGLSSMGMALGFLLGALFSATTFSPLLGGWRNVLILFGLAGALLSIPWSLTRGFPVHLPASGQQPSMRAAVRHVVRIKSIWLLGAMYFGVGGCLQGLLGYLPLYLRGLGWEAMHADGALSAFQFVSLVFVLPIALWSDRLGSRKRLLGIAAGFIAIGTGLLSFVTGGLVWLAVLMAGFARDGFMAMFFTTVIEAEGIGPVYAGTAAGLTMAIAGIGFVLAPPLGNSLAAFWPGAPFILWSGLALGGLVCLSRVNRSPTPAFSPAPAPGSPD